MSRQEEHTVMAYICKLKSKPGPLNLQKCVEAGVPPGPLLGQLKNGNDVSLPNGNVVKASDVRAPDDPGPAFVIIDVPSTEYLTSLENSLDAFKTFIEGPDAVNTELVIHFTPQHILETERYENFFKKFPTKTHHFLLNATNNFSGYFAAHRIQWQLNKLNEYIFPILKESPDSIESSQESPIRKKSKISEEQLSQVREETTSTENGNGNGPKWEATTALTCYHLRPGRGIDRSLEQDITPDEYIQESVAIQGFVESLESLKANVSGVYSNAAIQRESAYPKVVFLGTGSCIPNKTRNVSSILVHTNADSCVLLDCGEGTEGQIIRFYGKTAAAEVFRKLKMIYISHLHADHHIGLFGIIQTRRKIMGEDTTKLLLIAPQQIFSWLYFYDIRMEPLRKEYTLIPNADLLETHLADERVKSLGIHSISTCNVRHCPHSFGISFELDHSNLYEEKPIKITYSGDTMPCPELVDLGKNSTILIHEATMEDELEKEARMKMHSTLSQAIEQGKRMNARHTLLTHFSQRYAKLPRIENNLDANIGIAFDNMEVTLTDLKHLHLMYPTLKLLFIEQFEEMEQKALKRAYKNQRLTSRSSSEQSIHVL